MKTFLTCLLSSCALAFIWIIARRLMMYRRVSIKVKELWRKFDVIINYAIKTAPSVITDEMYSRYSGWLYDKTKTDAIFVAVLLYRYGIRMYYEKHDNMLSNCYKAHIDRFDSILGKIIDEIAQYVNFQMQQMKSEIQNLLPDDDELASLSISSSWALENVVQIDYQFPHELGMEINTRLNKFDLRKSFDNL